MGDCVLELRHKKVHPSKVHYLTFLSGPLNLELQRQVHEPLLLSYPAFYALKETCPAALRDICGQALSEVTFGKGDHVFQRGPLATHMYFVSNGTLVYRFRRLCGPYQLA